MASLNDTLTVGLILILLFGAVSLYLYTRVQQCEQKLNLVESILLDIKMSAELREYPELPAPVPVQKVSRSGSVDSDRSNDQARGRGNSRDNNNNNNNNHSEEALYASALEEAHLDAEASTLPPLEESASGVEVAEAVAANTTSKTEEGKAKSVPTVNYESMTLAELKAIGKQRSITGFSAMKRSQILEALRNADSKQTTVAGDLSYFLDMSSPLDEEGVETLSS
jgi:hypothetical protein